LREGGKKEVGVAGTCLFLTVEEQKGKFWDAMELIPLPKKKKKEKGVQEASFVDNQEGETIPRNRTASKKNQKKPSGKKKKKTKGPSTLQEGRGTWDWRTPVWCRPGKREKGDKEKRTYPISKMSGGGKIRGTANAYSSKEKKGKGRNPSKGEETSSSYNVKKIKGGGKFYSIGVKRNIRTVLAKKKKKNSFWTKGGSLNM